MCSKITIFVLIIKRKTSNTSNQIKSLLFQLQRLLRISCIPASPRSWNKTKHYSSNEAGYQGIAEGASGIAEKSAILVYDIGRNNWVNVFIWNFNIYSQIYTKYF